MLSWCNQARDTQRSAPLEILKPTPSILQVTYERPWQLKYFGLTLLGVINGRLYVNCLFMYPREWPTSVSIKCIPSKMYVQVDRRPT